MLGYSTDICRGRWVAPLQVFFLFSKAVLRIRDVYPVSDFFPSQIPDPRSQVPRPNFSIPDPGARIRIKEFKYFNQKKWFLSSRKYDQGCSSRIPNPDPFFLPIPDPGSGVKKAPDIGSKSATLFKRWCAADVKLRLWGCFRDICEFFYRNFTPYWELHLWYTPCADKTKT